MLVQVSLGEVVLSD